MSDYWSQFEEVKEDGDYWTQYEEGKKGSKPEFQESAGQQALRYGIKDPLIGIGETAYVPRSIGLLGGSTAIGGLDRLAKALGEAFGLPKLTEFAETTEKLKPRFIKEQADKKPDFEKLLNVRDSTALDKLIQEGVSTGIATLVPPLRGVKAFEMANKIPGIGKYLAPALERSIPSAVVAGGSGVQPDGLSSSIGAAEGAFLPFDILSEMIMQGSPVTRGAAKVGRGALAGLGAYEAAKTAGAGEGLSDLIAAGAGLASSKTPSKRQFARDIKETVEKVPEAQERIKASERLGLDYITPAEATGSPFLGAKEGGMGKSSEGSLTKYEKGEQRLKSEEKAIEKLLTSTYDPEKLSGLKQSLYKAAYEKLVPDEDISRLAQNDIVKRAVKNLTSKPAYKEELKNIDTNSLEFWDLTKRSLDDMVGVAENKGNKAEARLLKNTRKDLTETLDNLSPEYKQARALAEREITRNKLEKVFDKGDMKGLTMYKALERDSKYNDLLNNLRNAPEAQQQLKDMRLVFKNLISVPTARTAAALEKTNMTNPRGGWSDFINEMKGLVRGGKKDKQLVEFVTNPKWYDEMHELAKLGKGEKFSVNSMKLLSRALGKQISDIPKDKEEK